MILTSFQKEVKMNENPELNCKITPKLRFLNIKILTFFLLIITSIYISKAQNNEVLVDGVAAIIGKNIVLHSEIEMQYVQLQMNQQSSSLNSKCDILEELMLQKLLLAQANFDSVVVSDADVEKELERRMRFFISQIGSRDALEKFYNKSIIEIKNEFRGMIKDQLLIQKMQQQITTDVVVTPSEVRKFFNNLDETEIPWVELEFQLSHLVVIPEITFEEKELVRNRLAQLRERAIKGDSFGALAVMFSEDPGSAKKRGELGFFGRGEMFREFEAAAFRLQTPNEISPIIETKAGFHILQLIERRGELVNVRHILLTLKPSNQAIIDSKNKIDSIYNLIQSGNYNFEQAVVEFSTEETAKTNKGQLINPTTMNNRFLASHLKPQDLFAIENLTEGLISKPIPFEDENGNRGYRILYVNKRTEPHKANLNTDYPLIQELALEDKKQKVLNEWIIEKKKYTFIKINELYKDCTFEFDWLN